VSHADRVKPSRFPVLNWVLDTLVLREWTGRLMSSWLEAQLESWREHIKKFSKDVFVARLPTIGEFTLRRCKNTHFEFWLRNPEVCDVYVHRPEQFPKVHCQQTGMWYVIFRSKFLQFRGWHGARDVMKALAGLLCCSSLVLESNTCPPYLTISRADVAIDYANPEPFKFQMFSNYVARASRLKVEGVFSPFGSDSRTALETMIEREAGKSLSHGKKTKIQNVDPLIPREDNKGGLAYTTLRSGFSGGVNPVSSTLAAKAADYAVLEYLKNWSYEHQFENTARLTRVIGSAENVQTAYFGRFGGPVYLREYNKLLSIMVDDKKWLLDIWLENGWDAETPVWRCEFSFSNDFLRGFWDHNKETGTGTGAHVDLTHPEAFIKYIPTVWDYMTRTWVRHCVPPLVKDELGNARLEAIELLLSTMPTDAPAHVRDYLELETRKLKIRGVDENRSRWEPSERWQAIQNAWDADKTLMRLRRLPNPDSTRAIAQAKGNLISAIAKDVTLPPEPKLENFKITEDWVKALEVWREDLRTIILKASQDKLMTEMGTPETALEVRKRQSVFGNSEYTQEQFTDILMSNQARAELIAEGRGS
jgi:hypothetical protein